MNKVAKVIMKRGDTEGIVKFALQNNSKNCVRKAIKFLENNSANEDDILKLKGHLSTLSTSKGGKTDKPSTYISKRQRK